MRLLYALLHYSVGADLLALLVRWVTAIETVKIFTKKSLSTKITKDTNKTIILTH